jgi:hypothetical protein
VQLIRDILEVRSSFLLPSFILMFRVYGSNDELFFVMWPKHCRGGRAARELELRPKENLTKQTLFTSLDFGVKIKINFCLW